MIKKDKVSIDIKFETKTHNTVIERDIEVMHYILTKQKIKQKL